MAVGLSEPTDLLAIKGVKLATTACGIKKPVDGQPARDDLVLMTFAGHSVCAVTFTQNAFCAAPVSVAKKHLQQTAPRCFLINSGNANAGTGQQGMDDAQQSCRWVAEKLNCDATQVLPFSTGVIGEPLPLENLHAGITQLIPALDASNWLAAAHGIMTTDTIAKAVSEQVVLEGETITLTGIAKGSGMIKPDMATMLCFIATDASIEADLLQQYLSRAVDNSFNNITVDGDTSTNDACMLVATCQSSFSVIAEDPASEQFYQALERVCLTLAQAIIRDGEGATKFVTINIEQARSITEAKTVAYTIAHSPLVKTALFASDPNWGRILAAVGRAGLADLGISTVNIFLGDVCIVRAGAKSHTYTEAQGQAVMNQAEIDIRVELGRGEQCATIWTTDLSHDYISINSDYRS